MSTLAIVVALIICGFVGQWFWLTVLNIAGMPGALIGGLGRAGPARVIFGTLLSIVGQSYIYLGWVAGVVLLAKVFTNPPRAAMPIFVWPAAFFAAVFPIYLCAAAAGAEYNEGSKPQAQAVLIGQFIAAIGFFAFAFFPDIMRTGWPWIGWVLRSAAGS